jgi:hypothetical protein
MTMADEEKKPSFVVRRTGVSKSDNFSTRRRTASSWKHEFIRFLVVFVDLEVISLHT